MNNFRLFTPYLAGQEFLRDITFMMVPGSHVSAEAWQDGFIMQSFSLLAEDEEQASILNDGFYNWLGYHFEEQVEGQPIWDGLVCQMELVNGRTIRRRSLIDTEKPTHNAIRAQYTADSLNESDELLENGSFAALDPGSSLFVAWEDFWGNGTITGTLGGVDLQAGNAANTYILTRVHVQESTKYRFSFYTKNSASPGRYYVKDVTNNSFIQAITSTGAGATLTQITYDFTTPAGCSGVELGLYCPTVTSDIAFFDDVSFMQFKPLVFNSAWAIEERSIERYGRIEHTIKETSEYTQTEAEQLRDMLLIDRAWPNAYPVSISAENVTAVRLDLVICGYIVTADWQESTVTLSVATDISDVINDLITTNQEFLSVGHIEPNTLEIETLKGLTARQRIANIVPLADSQKDGIYRAYVGPGRLFYYLKINDFTPEYQLMVDGIRQRLSGPLTPPHEVHPAVLRDHTHPMGGPEQGSLLQDARDTLITEVQRRSGQDFPDLRTSELSESDIYSAQLAHSHNR